MNLRHVSKIPIIFSTIGNLRGWKVAQILLGTFLYYVTRLGGKGCGICDNTLHLHYWQSVLAKTWVGYLQKGLNPFFEKIEIIGNSEALLTKVYVK
jgi:hypothetical protein